MNNTREHNQQILQMQQEAEFDTEKPLTLKLAKHQKGFRKQIPAPFCAWLCIIVVLCKISVFGASPPHPEPKMTFLDNGEVRIGMDLALGGAVTFISSKDLPATSSTAQTWDGRFRCPTTPVPGPLKLVARSPTRPGLGWVGTQFRRVTVT